MDTIIIIHKRDMEFQIIDWNEITFFGSNADDKSDSDTETDSDSDSEEQVSREYILQIFGKTMNGESVCINVHNVYPYLYLKTPDKYLAVRSQLDTYLQRGVKAYEYVQRMDYCGFQGDEKTKFVKLSFKTPYMLSVCKKKLEKRYKIYEGNSGNSLLQYIHDRGLSGCSWVKIEEAFLKRPRNALSRCALEFDVLQPDKLFPVLGDDPRMAPFRILSYDLEVTSEDGSFPVASRANDKIIQIGMTFNYFQNPECYKKVLINLGTCDPVEGVEVISCKTEKEVISMFARIVNEQDPDVMTGYNIFGFDNKYIHDRAKGISFSLERELSSCSRLVEPQRFQEKKLSSSALGDNTMYYYSSPGRVSIDLMKIVMNNHSLEKYSLDFVSSHFNQNDITHIGEDHFETVDVDGISDGCFLKIKKIDIISNTEEFLDDKLLVSRVDRAGKRVYFESGKGPVLSTESDVRLRWCLAKDDITPSDIFAYFEKDAYHRSIIAKYCVKDCTLVNHLMEKLDVVSNSIAMSNVCKVPLNFIFTRGQGIKAYSLIKSKANERGYLFPTIQKDDILNKKVVVQEGSCHRVVPLEHCSNEGCESNRNLYIPCRAHVLEKSVYDVSLVCVTCNHVQFDTSFDGAHVKDPIPGYYTEPIVVMDFASLYPNSIIQKNMSGETQILDSRFENVPGYIYYDIEYKTGQGSKKCRFVRKEKGHMGIIPETLNYLLETRARIKKQMKKETNIFKKRILDGQQLAMKVTANSIYGQTGAITSPIYLKDIAACTTATGKEMLKMAERFMTREFPRMLADGSYEKHLEEKEILFVKEFCISHSISPMVVYGDTDSTFVSLNIKKGGSGRILEDREGRELSIRLGRIAETLSQIYFPAPQKLEYEKVYHRLLLFCKKKYCGRLYENNPDKFYVNNMGVVLKRRDNAKIVKKICGTILNIMFTEEDYKTKCSVFVRQVIDDIYSKKFDLSYFTMTKSLRGRYKGKKMTDKKYKCNCSRKGSDHEVSCAFRSKPGDAGTWDWDDVKCSIAHVNLCQRMKKRDPGSAPNSNDRISYVHVVTKDNKCLQGDRIEELSYVMEKNLEVDYRFYVENQVKNPAIQFLELLLHAPEELFVPEKKGKQTKISQFFNR